MGFNMGAVIWFWEKVAVKPFIIVHKESVCQGVGPRGEIGVQRRQLREAHTFISRL